MPGFGTCIRTPEADRAKLRAEWRQPREPQDLPKIKYCNELTCSIPNCEPNAAAAATAAAAINEVFKI